MTLKELIEVIQEENDETLFKKELAYFIKDNPDGTFDAKSICSIGISDKYLLLANKNPQCDN